MPEGDLIFRAARTLHRALAGHLVTRFETGYAQLARVDDDTPLTGQTIERCESAGKHLLLAFSGGLVLRTHMRMNGSWHLYRHGERWWRDPREMRIRIDTADWVAVAFNVPVAEFVSERELERRGPVAALGTDLLAGERKSRSDLPLQFDRAEAIRRLAACADLPIARALLDQRVIAGIGNIFKSEVLFLAGVHPDSPARTLDDLALGTIVDVAETLLRSNVLKDSGTMITTVRGLRQSNGRAGPTERLYVYGRRGRPCRRCGTPIMSHKKGVEARPTFWCPTCQPEEGRQLEEERSTKKETRKRTE